MENTAKKTNEQDPYEYYFLQSWADAGTMTGARIGLDNKQMRYALGAFERSARKAKEERIKQEVQKILDDIVGFFELVDSVRLSAGGLASTDFKGIINDVLGDPYEKYWLDHDDNYDPYEDPDAVFLHGPIDDSDLGPDDFSDEGELPFPEFPR